MRARTCLTFKPILQMMPAQVAHLDQAISSMPNILAIHASDANPVLETFSARLDAGPISFLNVQDVPNADELRSLIFEISRDIDICLIFSSDLLLRVLRPLSRSQETRRERYLLSNSRTIAIQLNSTRPSRNVRAVARTVSRHSCLEKRATLADAVVGVGSIRTKVWFDLTGPARFSY